jgi:site-specific DNA-methyltransferase (adenine-specific)
MQNRLILGDNRIVLSGLADDSVDLTIGSPPYHLQRKYNGHGSGNEANLDAYFDNLEVVFAECLRITKPTGAVIVNLGDQWRKGGQVLLPHRFAIRVLDRFKVTLVNDVTWTKPNPNPFVAKDRNRKWLGNCMEQFFVFAKGKDYYFDPQPFRDDKPERRPVTSEKMGESYRKCLEHSNLSAREKYNGLRELETLVAQVKDGTIEGFRIIIRGHHALPQRAVENGPSRDVIDNGYHVIRLHGVPLPKNIVSFQPACRKDHSHPAIFPIGLIEKFINGFCQIGGLVLDPYMGTGSTALAALLTGRKYIGVEIDHQYFDDSVRALSLHPHKGQQT